MLSKNEVLVNVQEQRVDFSKIGFVRLVF